MPLESARPTAVMRALIIAILLAMAPASVAHADQDGGRAMPGSTAAATGILTPGTPLQRSLSSSSTSARVAAGCDTGTLGVSFATPVTSGTVADAGEIDCYVLAEVAAGDRLDMAFSYAGQPSGPRVTVRDGDGNAICVISSSSECALTGRSGWQVQVDDSNRGTYSYELAARRLNTPAGCVAIPADALSFAGGRVNASIPTSHRANCHTFTPAASDGDAALWARVVRTSGTLSPRWRIVDAAGSVQCTGISNDFSRCPVFTQGQFALVVDDRGQTRTGAYYLTLKQITDPAGCGAAGSTAYGQSPLAGGIGTVGEIDCHALSGLESSDRIDVHLAGGSGGDMPTWSVVDRSGNEICASRHGSGSQCLMSGDGPWSLLVWDAGAGTGTFDYQIAPRRLTRPEGCTEFGDGDPLSFAAPRVTGSIDAALGARCYSLTRSAAQQDDAVWVRALRSSGELSPRWRLFGPSGAVECQGSGEDYRRCDLRASGQLALVVDDSSAIRTGSFVLTAKRTTRPSGCAAVPSASFVAAAIGGSLSAGGEVDCHTLSGVQAGDRVETLVRTSQGAGRWTLVDGGGNSVCESRNNSECELTGTGDWSVLVYESGGLRTGTYDLAVRRLTRPEGCSTLGDPAVWSFTAPRIDGSLGARLQARCFTFTRALGEEDGSYWLRTARTTGALAPDWTIYGPTGARECEGSSGDYEQCRLLASGTFTVVVADQSGEQTGSFFLTARETSSPAGCTALPSIAFGIRSVSGNISTGGEVDCYTVSASSDDRLKFSSTGTGNQISVLSADGTKQCAPRQTVCTIADGGPTTILVYPQDITTTGRYTFQAACENEPCGQSDTAVTDVSPNRVGPGKSTTVLLRGRDLDLLREVRLKRESSVKVATLRQPAADGRAVEVGFDLTDAANGSWELEATFADGTVRTVPNALTVEAQRPASLSVEMVGREVFRAGQPTTVTLQITNGGNVDAVGAPVVLRGIPAGSTVEPAFPWRTSVYEAGEVRNKEVAFDQAQDTATQDGEIIFPTIVPRVPAGRSVALEYRVQVPAATDFSLAATVLKCLDSPVTGASRRRTWRAGNEDVNCAVGFASFVADVAIGQPCLAFGTGQVLNLMGAGAGGDGGNSPLGLADTILAGGACGIDLINPFKKAERAAKVIEWMGGAGLGLAGIDTVQSCVAAADTSTMPQRAVTSIDPNDIRGPVGTGAKRYLTGEQPLNYQVLFENLPAATAPAQRVEVVNRLDTTKLDPATVLFRDVKFGSTSYALPYASPEIDRRIDLRPAQDLLVDVDARVAPDGVIRWTLQALDPETLAPPEDPLAIG